LLEELQRLILQAALGNSDVDHPGK
jgi:hypothetical protein